MNVKPILKTAQKFVTDNSPGILTGLAVAGTVTTAVLAGKATWDLAELVNKTNSEDDINDLYMSPKKKFEMGWKLYIPAAVSGAATVTCVIAATRIGTRRAAAIAAAFKISEELAEQYKAKVVETMGAKKEEMMRADLARDRMDEKGWKDVVFISGSEVLFFDELSGRFFKNEKAKVDKAINEINYQINNYYHASLSEFYEKIGLPSTIYSDEVGWNSDELLDVKFAATLLEDDKPAIAIAFRTTPIRGFDRCH